LAKRISGDTAYLYKSEDFFKNNIYTAGGSVGPAMNINGYIMKRSILGSIECFEKFIKQNNCQGESISVKINKDSMLTR